MTDVLVADVGRTTCRVAHFDAGGRRATAAVASGASLADPDGVGRIAAAITAAMAQLPEVATPDSVVVGTTGLAQAPAAGSRLADVLGHANGGVEVVLASDVLTAHIGALGGAPGVCLVAGTGAVALAVPAEGAATIVDGHGYLLGDDGSGFAVGRAGLRAALRHHDGRAAGSARLAEDAQRRFGPLGQLPGAVQSAPDAVRRIAGFSVEVAAAARYGDPQAIHVWRRAVEALTETVTAACHHVGTPTVAVGLAGSLIDLDDLVTAPLTAAITAACPGARPQRARGDALDGGRCLADPLPGLDSNRLQADGLLLRIPRGAARLA